jgi:hypothetical protein
MNQIGFTRAITLSVALLATSVGLSVCATDNQVAAMNGSLVRSDAGASTGGTGPSAWTHVPNEPNWQGAEYRTVP